MALDDGSIDECGTGRYTPPPPYQNLLSKKQNQAQIEATRQNEILQRQEQNAANAAAVTYITRMMTDDTQDSIYEPDYDKHEEYHEITKNTRKSAESLEEIHSLMSHQETMFNCLLSIGSAITFIIIVIYYWYDSPSKYRSKQLYSALAAIKKLNLTEEAEQIIENIVEKSAFIKLKKCIMTNLKQFT